VIDHVEYTIDVTESSRYDESGALVAPGARRIRNLTFKGAPVDPNQPFLVVTNNLICYPSLDRRKVEFSGF
jgi:2',3'-cyclic-nucleotide 2'-phosphodiesterase (5'-nucleotidase family)